MILILILILILTLDLLAQLESIATRLGCGGPAVNERNQCAKQTGDKLEFYDDSKLFIFKLTQSRWCATIVPRCMGSEVQVGHLLTELVQVLCQRAVLHGLLVDEHFDGQVLEHCITKQIQEVRLITKRHRGNEA